MSLKTPVQLSPKQLARVSESLVLQPGEELLLIFDATLFGSAEAGVAITDRRLATYGKRRLEWVAYADLTGVRVEHDATGLGHTLRATARDGHVIVLHVYLPAVDLDTLLAQVRAHMPGGVPVDEPTVSVAGAARYTLADKPIVCPHCGSGLMHARAVALQTHDLGPADSPWLAQQAVGLACAACGLLALFARPPTRVTD